MIATDILLVERQACAYLTSRYQVPAYRLPAASGAIRICSQESDNVLETRSRSSSIGEDHFRGCVQGTQYVYVSSKSLPVWAVLYMDFLCGK